MSDTTSPLSPQEVEHFLTFGFVKVEACFDLSPGSVAHRWVGRLWQRLGVSPDAPDTWPDKVHMPAMEHAPMRQIAPKAWDVACQLCGGEARIRDCHWGDAFIANFHFENHLPRNPPNTAKGGWHKDGDFFLHFLDSPEQALLTIVLWSDVLPDGGPTWIACDSVKLIAQHLAANPQGLHPNEVSGGLIKQCTDVRAATGKAGDVYFMHPYMLHTSSPNHLGVPRLITNPPIAFKEPMCFNRPGGDHSPVEQAVLRALGVDAFDFQPTAPRQKIVPERIKRQQQMLEDEQRRLAASS